MNCTSTNASFAETGFFSKITLDYIANTEALQPFYKHSQDINGIQQAIAARQAFPTNRQLLVDALKEQYVAVSNVAEVNNNIESLLQENTFTIVTAHQPNIFTGYLYFVYKILHTIKLASELKQQLPQYNFVPVYYMGSEDADLDELGKVTVDGQKFVWQTTQTGAVGRMKVDKALLKMIDAFDGQLSIFPHGKELIQLLRECYAEGSNIQTATFKLTHTLFAKYGLIVLIPDSAALKATMHKIFEEDFLHKTPSSIVEGTIKKLDHHYKVQANPREINLFYLKDNIRERIVENNGGYKVDHHQIHFTKEELQQEHEQHPERFSPNVILRGMFQETILPNIVFIGGGGELAYWLELKDLFGHYNVPYPVLLLRNSFLVVEKKWNEKISHLNFEIADFFKPENILLEKLVKRDSNVQVDLNNEFKDFDALYKHLKEVVSNIDTTLLQHIDALHTKSAKQLQNLQKKMLRAEKRKFSAQQRQISVIRQALFPNNSLQERTDNFMPFYAQYGPTFIDCVYKNTQGLGKEFITISLP
jgi:bacillithiol biosynthesis cysteine-adding enzyme BshC